MCNSSAKPSKRRSELVGPGGGTVREAQSYEDFRAHREVPGEMTTQRFHRFGGGFRSSLRSPSGGDKAWALIVALGLLVIALPAFAAEIVEVRVGKHPTFTRVVFELDRSAGYRIERSDSATGVAELVVSLEASSIPRSIKASKSFIALVEVEPQGGRSVVRVRLSQEGLHLKEMILANPPRIVLDLLNEPPAIASVAKTKPAPAPSEPGTSEDDAFDAVVAQIDREPIQEAFEPEPAPVVEIEPADDLYVASVIEATEAVEAEVVTVADQPADEAEAFIGDDSQADLADAAGVFGSADTLGSADALGSAGAGDEPSTSTPVDEGSRDPYLAENARGNAGAPGQAERKPRPMVAKSTTDDGGDWMTWALVAGGAVVLLLGRGLFLARRRGASDSDSDNWDDADSGQGFGNEETAVAAEGMNPFADADEATMLGAPDDETIVAPLMNNDDDDATIVSVSDEEKESESVVFDDSEETAMDDMEVISRDQVNESLGSPAMPQAMGAGVPEDMAQMFAEMTRRMEGLESRCDELVDARDRLERQVAAQTEELRVQRAAIARTQRAVRNLGRGDESEEQGATEPALRDPNQPSAE